MSEAGGRTRAGRKSQLESGLRDLRAFVFDQMNQSQLTPGERKASFDLMVQVGELTRDLAAAADDQAALRLERDRMRPLAEALHLFGQRHHLLLARPYWEWPPAQADSSRVAFVGGEPMRDLLSPACRARGLAPSEPGSGGGSGSERWAQLRSASLAVFDLTEGAARTRPSTCHALGFALALGLRPVVLKDRGHSLPFDIDLLPVELGGGPEDPEILGEGLDRALFSPGAAGGGSSVAETVAFATEALAGSEETATVALRALKRNPEAGPLEVAAVLEQVIALGRRRDVALLRPTWPGFYPADEARCFHVMPFGEEWSRTARDRVAKACETARVRYRRGDETQEQRIILSIWEEICRATHVVVDLTGLNPNVCLELGLAQAVGVPALLVVRDDVTIAQLYPEIAKLQVRPCSPSGLEDLVAEFVSAPAEHGWRRGRAASIP